MIIEGIFDERLLDMLEIVMKHTNSFDDFIYEMIIDGIKMVEKGRMRSDAVNSVMRMEIGRKLDLFAETFLCDKFDYSTWYEQ
jgi:hypothetical protein